MAEIAVADITEEFVLTTSEPKIEACTKFTSAERPFWEVR